MSQRRRRRQRQPMRGRFHPSRKPIAVARNDPQKAYELWLDKAGCRAVSRSTGSKPNCSCAQAGTRPAGFIRAYEAKRHSPGQQWRRRGVAAALLSGQTAGSGRRGAQCWAAFGAAVERRPETGMSDGQMVEKLADSAMYREFQQAFEDATPAAADVAGGGRVAAGPHRQPESKWLLRLDGAGEQILLGVPAIAATGLRRSRDGPNTLTCILGLNETVVGVKMGRRTIAYLQTGQVFFKAPTPSQTRRALKQIKNWGVRLDVGAAARSYEATRVVRRREYRRTVEAAAFFCRAARPAVQPDRGAGRTAEPDK